MLRARLNEALKTAMKARDEIGVATLRLILAALKDRDIAARGRGQAAILGDDEILSLLQSMIRQRRESVAAYEKGGRPDLVAREEGEIRVIETFLPRQLDEAAATSTIESLIAELGAKTIKDMGRVMAELRSRYAGQMDLTQASALVKSRLS
jgi:uncharacterized protein YqeY